MSSNFPESGNPAIIARYISVDIFGRMLTYGAVVAGGLGFWRYEMIKRECAARIAAEERERFMATIDELATERQQAAADRQQAAEERLRLMDTINDLVAQQRNGNHGGNDHGSNGQ